MIIRRIRAEELRRCAEMAAVAYEFPLHGSDETAEEAVRRMEENPRDRSQKYWHMRWAAFADDDQTMMSAMAVMPFRMNFDGHNVRMDGVGGVASFPQYRNGGGVRGCFEAALPVMYDEGAVFSYLHPFRNVLYRKFGYEMAAMGLYWKIDLRLIPKKKMPGSCVLAEKGVDLRADLMKVARAWQQRYNCMVIGEDVEYAWAKDPDPFAEKTYTYLYRSAEGEPKGYLTCRPQEEDGEDVLKCRRFVFADREGFEGLLMLLASMSADHSYAHFLTPEDISPDALIPEWQNGFVHCERVTKGMARVINVEKALQLAAMRGEGSLVIEVEDTQIPQNNGRFEASFAPGKENRVERTEKEPDISLTIQDFTRLILGKHSTEDFAWLPQVRLNCSAEKAAKVFYRKPVFLCQSF